MSKNSFSKRHGYAGQPKEISIQEDAPEKLRYFVLEKAVECGLTPGSLRAITCSVLEERPNPDNWSAYPNIWNEVENHVYGCEWFQVYDIIERTWGRPKAKDDDEFVLGEDRQAPAFEKAINDFFVRNGIGWQLVNGEIVVRGTEVFEATVKTAKAALEESERPTAAKHIHEALQALSRRPEPNLSGAIYHALASLECLTRDVTGDQKSTLGEILKKHPDLLPRPLDTALSQIWGYRSNVARHVLEGHEPERAEAELVVHRRNAASRLSRSQRAVGMEATPENPCVA